MANLQATRINLWRISFVVVAVALLVVPFQTARGIGSRKILLQMTGTATEDTQIRVALIASRHARFVTETRQPELDWRKVLPEEDLIEDQITVVTSTPIGLLLSYKTTRYPYQDVVAVEYRTGDQSPRFRLIFFELGTPPATIEVNIPREPPSDAEAWLPE